jgi:hypothetical protein
MSASLIRTLCFKTMCSRGITVGIHLPANSVSHCPRLSRHSLASVPLSSSGMYSFLRKEGTPCALFFSHPGTSREPREASGVALTLLHWSAIPHASQVSRSCLEKPSMKSKARASSTMLYYSPASVSTRATLKKILEKHTLFTSHRRHKKSEELTGVLYAVHSHSRINL